MNKIKQKTLNETLNQLEEYGKCCVIRPTGYGKTFLAFNAMGKYKNMVFLYPRRVILQDIKDKYKEIIDKIQFHAISYKKISSMNEDELYDLIVRCNEPDTLIVMDEVHMACASTIMPKVEYIMDNIIENHILGLTATPDRADGLNPVVDLFDCHTISEYTLSDAINDGLFEKPHYIRGTFELDETLLDLQNRANSNTNLSMAQLDTINKSIIDAGKLDITSTLDKYLNELVLDKSYMKILIFFPTRNILKKKMGEYKKIFKKIFPTHRINIVSIYGGDSQSDNISDMIDLTRRKNTIDIVASIDMLSLGYHVDDITAIIMNRPTCSNIIFKQQIGRCFNVISDMIPIIFDFVGNYSRKQYHTNVLNYDDRKNPDVLIEETFGSLGNIKFHDRLVDVENIERLVSIGCDDWTEAVIDAYLNKGAPIEYCISKLNITEEAFKNLISSYK